MIQNLVNITYYCSFTSIPLLRKARLGGLPLPEYTIGLLDVCTPNVSVKRERNL